jgi:hypothetical protein
MEANARADVKSEGDRWAEWFYGQRAYPSETIPQDAMGKAFNSAIAHNKKGNGRNGVASTLAAAPGSGASATRNGITALASLPSWTELGPSRIPRGQTDLNGNTRPRTTVSGRVSAIAVDPGDVPATRSTSAAPGGV